ncbi:transporter [Ferruginivarius sediminum]|uniref:Transporter n=1 Tax=Ferruginivarius sediminum TaxID=2661937 RepID=A0A369TCE6_9PROT|nr:transporter [Ferruginivarius sediminum]RDD62979.1 transporter [Ferruginivarius sediminum]
MNSALRRTRANARVSRESSTHRSGYPARLVAAVSTLAIACTLSQGAAAEDTAEVIEKLRQRIQQQEQQLRRQKQMLLRQEQELEYQREQLDSLTLDSARARGTTSADGSEGTETAAQADTRQRTAQAEPAETAPTQRPEAEERQFREGELTLIRDRGGVLTPQGTFVLEPELEFATSSSNRFFFQGVEVVEAVLFGIIEASETQRERVTAALGGRYGVTDRFEVDVRVPYIYRNDRIESTGVNDPTFSSVRDIEGDGLGDLEFGAHYQLNSGREDWPLFVGNLRVGAPTGEGPFDVDRDENGLESELPTGSGFWSVEPSITAIVPTDPAVVFGNIGYAWNISRDVDERIPNAQDDVDGVTEIGEVDVGDSINASFGVGVGLNDRLSFSLGYEHSYVLATDTEVDGQVQESDEVHVASFLFGGNYALSPRTAIDLRVAAGLTEEAEDARVTLRVPITF